MRKIRIKPEKAWVCDVQYELTEVESYKIQCRILWCIWITILRVFDRDERYAKARAEEIVDYMTSEE